MQHAAWLGAALLVAAGPAPAPRDFAVKEEQITFTNGEVKLVGTLLLPASDRPVPAVVFVHGASYHERDDNRIEAEHFARRGIAALIYDKRGCGASGGDWTRASEFDLAGDALAAVRLLNNRPAIDAHHLGLWGMSQGASLIVLAAPSPDVAFLVAVSGCMWFEEQMYYYRENLFAKYELPDSLLDVANKTSLVRNDLGRRIRDGLPAPASWREQCAFDTYHDYRRDWAKVKQPVLAVYGEHDQAVPVAESVRGLKEALTEGGNPDWTIRIYQDAGHTLEQTTTGELFAEWRGYVPGFLDDVTNWILERATVQRRTGGGVQGDVPAATLRYQAARYDTWYWYGNSLVQLPLLVGFFIVFLVGTVRGSVGLWRRRPLTAAAPPWDVKLLAGVLCLLNLALLVALVLLGLALGDQRRPECWPTFLWLPAGGSLSVALTVLLLARLVLHWRRRGIRLRRAAFAVALGLFLPFLLYWNLVGTRF
jgi:dienelactone hydrolase